MIKPELRQRPNNQNNADADKQANTQTRKQTSKQTNRQTNRQTYIHTRRQTDQRPSNISYQPPTNSNQENVGVQPRPDKWNAKTNANVPDTTGTNTRRKGTCKHTV